MNILETIVEHKREEITTRKSKVKSSALSDMEFYVRQPLSMTKALRQERRFSIIAEIKRSSPTAGSIKQNISPQSLAQEYESNGAAGISVLTDERFFSGTLDDLKCVRQAVSLPLLRKDFIIDEYQLFEAKAYGADAILLIAAILEKSQLMEYHSAAGELGLECLVELYEQKEIDKLNFDRMKLIGINNRDLRTFTIDLNRTFEIAQHVPKDMTLVSESGIQSSNDLMRLKSAGVHAALIGEYLMKAVQPGKALKELLQDLNNETVD